MTTIEKLSPWNKSRHDYVVLVLRFIIITALKFIVYLIPSILFPLPSPNKELYLNIYNIEALNLATTE